MGGRIATQVAAADRDFTPAGLVLFGYPLHPPGRPDRVRDEHLYDLKMPVLFVEGTRDPFCPLDTLEDVTSKMSGAVEIAVIEDGDHSLKVRKASGRSTPEAWREAVARVTDWLGRLG
jgi:predicted alpha/beta-hydrolase family hydrolase